MSEARIVLCLRCRQSSNEPGCAGPCPCPVDGRDILAHVAAQFCPRPSGPRFGTAVAPADWAAVPLVQVGVPQPRPAPEPVKPVPRDQWPLSIKALALVAQPGDTGIGDVAHRVLAGMGADALAKLYEQATGRPCQCADRAAKLNALYPLKFDGD